MAIELKQESGTDFSHLLRSHPCLSAEAHVKFGRMHLPVSYACNIQCDFCIRKLKTEETRPGVAYKVMTPDESIDTVKKALELCPEIQVIGIAGPGDTLASPHAIETFTRIHAEFPDKILCLSTNGLMLPQNVDRLWGAGVRTISVTVNAVDPEILRQIVSKVVWEGEVLHGLPAAERLIHSQLTGIRAAARKGFLVKSNAVLIPGVNDTHIAAIAETLAEAGASMFNIIPLIPQGKFKDIATPSCAVLGSARKEAEAYLPVFRHCKQCRADACGIPGKHVELSALLYGYATENTFSHG